MYFPITKQNEDPNFVEVKGHKYLSFFHFPKIRAGKSVKQVNKIELPNCACDIKTLYQHMVYPLAAPVQWPSGGWIKANINQTAFYRVNYEVENWLEIGKYLKTADLEASV